MDAQPSTLAQLLLLSTSERFASEGEERREPRLDDPHLRRRQELLRLALRRFGQTQQP